MKKKNVKKFRTLALVVVAAAPFVACISMPLELSKGEPLKCCACRALAVATGNPTIALCR